MLIEKAIRSTSKALPAWLTNDFETRLAEAQKIKGEKPRLRAEIAIMEEWIKVLKSEPTYEQR